MRLVWVLTCSVLVGCLTIPSLAQVKDDVLREMNRARTQPELYAKELRDYWDRVTFRGTIYSIPGDRTNYITHEGRPAVDEAIAFIERQQPIPPLRHSGAHALAARDLAASQGPKGLIGHTGPDGSSPQDRIKRHGGDLKISGEVIYYGGKAQSDAADVVRSLIIDDGVADRGHRRNIFDPRFLSAGVGCGPHRQYGGMCVVNMGPDLKP
jgi:uncharacterized protein YkwD